MTAFTTREWQGQRFGIAEKFGDTATELESAVVSTISYSDLFGYAPSIEEITRYLHRVPADAKSVESATGALAEDGRLISDGKWYALPGRGHFFEQRRARMRTASQLWIEARRYAKALASIPTVRMVGVTGSLAVDNTEAGADIDLMLIVDGGTLWRTRAIAKLMQLTSRRLGGNLCANYFLSDRALTLNEESLYVAHELTQMVVLYGLDTYETFRHRNEWTRNFLPNALGAPRDLDPVKPSRLIRETARPLVLSAPASRLEQWECERKLHLYNDTDFQPGQYSRYSREATGHRLNIRDQIESQHGARLRDADPARPLRLLFGQSYHLYFDPKLWREMRPYPPLGSLYGAAVAREAGHEVRFFDSMLATNN
ncbi:MAG TPA: hypothetical protein VIV14_05640, partial [Gammaproteobacteria bacterium]